MKLIRRGSASPVESVERALVLLEKDTARVPWCAREIGIPLRICEEALCVRQPSQLCLS